MESNPRHLTASESEVFYRTILNSTEDLYFMVSPDLKLLAFNAAGENDLRQRRGATDETLETTFQEVFNYHERGKDEFDRALKGERTEAEREISYPSGNKIWYLVRFQPAYDQGRQIVGVCLVLTNIQVRKMQENEIVKKSQALQQSMEKYNAIIASSKTGAWEYHADTKTHWCSREYFEMLGLNPEVFLAKESLDLQEIWFDLLHPDDKEIATTRFESYLRQGSPGMFENYFRMRHQNGNWLWIWSRGMTLANPDGTKSAITLGTFIDITERKNLEIELMRHNERLIKYSHQIAHEVRGPLARLLGLINLSKIDSDLDYGWIFDKVQTEAKAIDCILSVITQDLDKIEQFKVSSGLTG